MLEDENDLVFGLLIWPSSKCSRQIPTCNSHGKILSWSLVGPAVDSTVAGWTVILQLPLCVIEAFSVGV